MAIRIQPGAILRTFLFLVTCTYCAAVHATPSEDALAKINKLPPTERQAALVNGAKGEKGVVWYAPMNREDLRQFTTAFEAGLSYVSHDDDDLLLNAKYRILAERRNSPSITARSSIISSSSCDRAWRARSG